MGNLKKETLLCLEKHGKTKDDIKWIGCSKFKIPIDLFWMVADNLYDEGYGTEEVAADLLIVGDDWWLERHEYDGAEWWEYKSMCSEPEEIKDVPTLFPYKDTKDIYKYYLEDFYYE